MQHDPDRLAKLILPLYRTWLPDGLALAKKIYAGRLSPLTQDSVDAY